MYDICDDCILQGRCFGCGDKDPTYDYEQETNDKIDYDISEGE